MEGFLCFEFGGLIFGGAYSLYFQNFMVLKFQTTTSFLNF